MLICHNRSSYCRVLRAVLCPCTSISHDDMNKQVTKRQFHPSKRSENARLRLMFLCTCLVGPGQDLPQLGTTGRQDPPGRSHPPPPNPCHDKQQQHSDSTKRVPPPRPSRAQALVTVFQCFEIFKDRPWTSCVLIPADPYKQV